MNIMAVTIALLGLYFKTLNQIAIKVNFIYLIGILNINAKIK
jgi:hypothetical protein